MSVNNSLQIILASKSPRRKEILERMGYSFSIIVADTDESITEKMSVEEQVRTLALRKAQALKALCGDDCVIIGSDTMLEFEGQALGKPKDEDDAKQMLSSLSGKSHFVHTSVALLYRGKALVSSDKTTVNMRPYTKEDIDYYVGTGDPMDKAGSYGIQSKGGFLVSSIEGEMDTVVGFPSRLFSDMLAEITK
jgi:septum formation protein